MVLATDRSPYKLCQFQFWLRIHSASRRSLRCRLFSINAICNFSQSPILVRIYGGAENDNIALLRSYVGMCVCLLYRLFRAELHYVRALYSIIYLHAIYNKSVRMLKFANRIVTNQKYENGQINVVKM